MNDGFKLFLISATITFVGLYGFIGHCLFIAKLSHENDNLQDQLNSYHCNKQSIVYCGIAWGYVNGYVMNGPTTYTQAQGVYQTNSTLQEYCKDVYYIAEDVGYPLGSFDCPITNCSDACKYDNNGIIGGFILNPNKTSGTEVHFYYFEYGACCQCKTYDSNFCSTSVYALFVMAAISYSFILAFEIGLFVWGAYGIWKGDVRPSLEGTWKVAAVKNSLSSWLLLAARPVQTVKWRRQVDKYLVRLHLFSTLIGDVPQLILTIVFMVSQTAHSYEAVINLTGCVAGIVVTLGLLLKEDCLKMHTESPLYEPLHK